MTDDKIQWFPGHMAQTRRLIKENLPKVDVILEIRDARIPKSSANPEIPSLINGKKRVIVLNKADLADPAETDYFINSGCLGENCAVVAADSKKKKGVSEIVAEARIALSEKLKRDAGKGMNRPVRAMVVGIPNVGKSTVINAFCGKVKAKAENRPGVTLSPQWIKADTSLELLDMPGVLWPKFSDRTVAENLAVTGAIKDAVLQCEELSVILCKRLSEKYPLLLKERFGAEPDAENPYAVFSAIAKKRGMLIRGGEIDDTRCAMMLLDELRSGAIGRITLDER